MYDFFRKTLGFGDVTVYFEWYDNAKTIIIIRIR